MPKERADRVSLRLRSEGVETVTAKPFAGEPLPRDLETVDGVVVYGGTQSANDAGRLKYLKDEIDWIERWLATGKPFLGICLGGQLLASALGARVTRHRRGLHEIGFRSIRPTGPAPGFFQDAMHFYQWHNEGFDLPANAVELAVGEDFPCQAYRYNGSAFGLQFHPEVDAALMTQWMNESEPGSLAVPGGDARDKQLADAARYDPLVDRWISDFVQHWLALPAASKHCATQEIFE